MDRGAGVGWIAGRQSASTTYFINTIALDGFCATVWSKVPGIAKGKIAAGRALGKLLTRAKKMGYVAE